MAAATKTSSMVVVLMLFAGLLQSASAKTASVTWKFASSATEYDDWASQQNFVVGDKIEFLFDAADHDVFQVSQVDLTNCNLNNPILTNATSNATMTLDRPGYFGFICGFAGHCPAPGNMHMNVQVSALTPTPSPSSPPSRSLAPSPSSPPSRSPAPSRSPSRSPTPSPTLGPSPSRSPPSAPTPSISGPPPPPSSQTPPPASPPLPSDASNLQTRAAMILGALVAGCAVALL